MLCAYLDESYDSDVFYIAAAVAPEKAWEELEARYEVIRATTAELHGVEPTAELHGWEIMSGAGAWTQLRGKHREAAGVYRAALRAARDVGVQYILRGVDVRRLNARYRYPARPHSIVLGHVLERIDDHARNMRAIDKVIVVADEVAEEAEHRAQFDTYQVDGTPGYRPNRLEMISAPINFARSCDVAGLQAADLAAYLHRRRERTSPTHPRAVKTLRSLSAELDAQTVHCHTWVP